MLCARKLNIQKFFCTNKITYGTKKKHVHRRDIDQDLTRDTCRETMVVCRYFQPMKSSLPDPTGELSMLISSDAISQMKRCDYE